MRQNATRSDAKAPKMRLSGRRLWRAIKHGLPLQFGHEQLTSYGGLELVRRYFQLIELKARIRQALGKHTRGDTNRDGHYPSFMEGDGVQIGTLSYTPQTSSSPTRSNIELASQTA